MTETFEEADVLANHKEAITFLMGLFEPQDYLCITAIHSTQTWTDAKGKKHAQTQDYFAALEDATDDAAVAQLEKLNKENWNIYVCMAPLKNGAQSREAANIATIRHCFIEIDENGLEGLAGVQLAVAMGEIPEPSVINESSPNKFHVIWNVEGLSKARCKALNQTLVKKFGADKAAVDANRILRIPSFVNLKTAYNGWVVRTIGGNFETYDYTPELFKVPVDDVYDEESESDGTPIEFDATKYLSFLDEAMAGEPVVAGNGRHYSTLMSLAGRLRHYAADEDAIYKALVQVCEKICTGYGTDYLDMCEHIASEIAQKPVGTIVGKATLLYDTKKHINVRVLLAYDETPTVETSEPASVAAAHGAADTEGAAALPALAAKQGAALSVEDEPLPDFTSMLKGSIADYARAIEPDFPMEFKVMAAITKVGLALSGKVFMVNGSSRLQPRFYTCLIAPPAFGKSGSVGTMALDFDRHYDEIFSLDSAPALVTTFRERYVHIHPAANKETVDAAVNSKGCEPLRVILLPDEMKDVFEKAKASKESKGNIGTYLLRLMEGNECSNNTKADGNIQIQSAHLAMLGGATPEGYDGMWMNTAGAMGGLQSRMTPVGTNNPMPPQKRRASDMDTADTARTRIYEQVTKAGAKVGIEITVNPAADAMLDSWWETVKLLDGSARVSDIVRRYLIVLAVTNDTTVVDERLMECGIAFGNHVLAMRSRHNPSDSTSPVQAMENRIIKAYQKTDGMSSRDASKRIHAERFAGGYGAFNQALFSLQHAGVLESRDEAKITKKTRLYLAT